MADGEDPGTRCEILYESWSILTRATLDFRLLDTFLGSNMAARHFEDPEDPVDEVVKLDHDV